MIASLVWTLIILNSFLLLLILFNFWSILIKREKWRTLPLLLFYILSLIAVILRLAMMVWDFTQSNWMWACALIQPNAKAAVGLIQSWMIFELSMRFRQADDKCLNQWKNVVMALILLLFGSGTVTLITVLVKNSDVSIIEDDKETIDKIFTAYMYTYLTLSIIMICVNIDLLLQMKQTQSNFI